MTNCHPIVEELESSSTNPGMLPISFATSVLRCLRRTLEEVTGAIDRAEAGPIVEEECLVQKFAREPAQVSHDDVTGLPLDSKLVADAIKEELMFMRKLQVYHEVPVSYVDKSGIEAIGARWVYTNKVMLRIHSFEQDQLRKKKTSRARNQESERDDTRGRKQHVCGYAPTGKPQGHAQSMYDQQV